MDEATLRRVVTEVVREELIAVRGETKAVREELNGVREEFKASEQRLAESGRLQFRQLGELYRATLEKVELLDKHLGERIDATRGAIEALRSALERQDFRSDELGRRIAVLETRPQQ